jgi:hypothetical protein
MDDERERIALFNMVAEASSAFAAWTFELPLHSVVWMPDFSKSVAERILVPHFDPFASEKVAQKMLNILVFGPHMARKLLFTEREWREWREWRRLSFNEPKPGDPDGRLCSALLERFPEVRSVKGAFCLVSQDAASRIAALCHALIAFDTVNGESARSVLSSGKARLTEAEQSARPN